MRIRIYLLNLTCLLTFVCASCYSQTLFSIHGVIIEKGSENPVKDMAVFLPYSAIGTTSSEDGTFILSKIPNGKYEIHFRHLGYEEYVLEYDTKYDTDKEYIISVIPKTFEFKEVTLTGDPSRRKAYLKIFHEFFLGDVVGFTCFLENPDNLYFYESKNILYGKSNKPLIILNKSFGYKIFFYLDEFRFMNPFGENINPEEQFYSFSGSPLYEKLEDSNFLQKLNWEKNREVAFQGSQRHFYISVIENKLLKYRYFVRGIYHSKTSAFKSIGMTDEQSKDPEIVIDSITDWGIDGNTTNTYYYFPLLDYPDLIYSQISDSISTIYVSDSILIFHDRYKTNSLKDDQAILLYASEGEFRVNEYGLPIDVEGDLLWKFIGSNRNLRSILPIDYFPASYCENSKKRKK